MRHPTFSFTALYRLAALAAVFLLAANAAYAQEAPTPRKMPRVPVGRQTLSDSDKTAIHTRDVKGPATVMDGEHLRVSNVDLRLFGIVPPQLSASFGPQARAALDEVSQGQDVECRIRDRDHDGRFLATCVTANGKTDMALELLKRGLAVAARGSVQPTELATPYLAAEQAAQTQKLGLWSVAPPPPATVPAAPPVPAPAPVKADNPNLPPLASELKKEDKQPPPVVVKTPAAPAPAAANNNGRTEKSLASLPPPVLITGAGEDEGAGGMPGFFARYQLLLTGFVMLITALGIMIVLAVERRRDRRDEMKAIAAALRGELLAARAVCQARLKTWSEGDERNTAWPRIRATLYQAYVGRLGWLGAVLARQIASIYGQATDYAAYFNPTSGMMETRETLSKRQALQTLIQHIEEVLPKLAQVEQTGTRPKGGRSAKPAAVASSSQAIGQETPAAAPTATTPLWDMVKRFAPSRHNTESRVSADEPLPDYTALIEEEMARMSAEEEAGAQSNITKMRGMGN